MTDKVNEDVKDQEAPDAYEGPTDRREILEFSGPHKYIGGNDTGERVWYCEGHSPVVDELEGGGTWFEFEAPYGEAIKHLRKLGFTHQEIAVAERDGEVDDGEATQRAEMRAETFAAEALMGMRPGTTEGWYDEPEPPDPYEEPEDDEYVLGEE